MGLPSHNTPPRPKKWGLRDGVGAHTKEDSLGERRAKKLALSIWTLGRKGYLAVALSSSSGPCRITVCLKGPPDG